MATEDLTTYTETDPSSRVTVTSTKCDVTGCRRDDGVTIVYDDKGAGYFSGDFQHNFDILTSDTALHPATSWMLSNEVNDWNGTDPYVNCSWYAATLRIHAKNGGNDSYAASTSTVYYCEAERDESVGTYGTLYLRIYSDAARTTLVDTLTITLTVAKTDYRYVYAMSNYEDGAAAGKSWYTENLDLDGGAAGGGLSIPIAMHHYKQLMGVN